MSEVKIHSGSRIKLKTVDEDALPATFLSQLREYAHKDERVQAIFIFAIEPEDQARQTSMAVAVKTGFFSKKDESFLQIVDEIRLRLPEDADLSFNLYRFGASEVIARFCLKNVEPVYLRATSWLEKQSKKHLKD